MVNNMKQKELEKIFDSMIYDVDYMKKMCLKTIFTNRSNDMK